MAKELRDEADSEETIGVRGSAGEHERRGTAAARRTLPGAHPHPPQDRPAVLHRQDAEQLPARRDDPAGAAERKDHRRAPASARLLLLELQAALRARPALQLRPRRPGPLLPGLRRSCMAHFDEALPGRVHRVHLRAAWSRTRRSEVRRLLDYCGLPFEAGCLRFFENERPVRTASSEQVRQPIYREGIDQWRHFEEWLDPLKDALGPVLRLPGGAQVLTLRSLRLAAVRGGCVASARRD